MRSPNATRMRRCHVQTHRSSSKAVPPRATNDVRPGFISHKPFDLESELLITTGLRLGGGCFKMC